jgi:meso-butanediol dehydrogenase / (S,S)-butanediol dehydrogenase / diacetyl reductase
MNNLKESSMRRFDNKVCLVTGAASGIGRATALRLASEGASIAAADINEQGLATLVDELGQQGTACIAIAFNALDEASSRAIAAQAVARFGRLDVLCNIAGACRADHFLDIRLADWERMFSINVSSLVAISQAALPHLIETRGNIVNMSSASALCGAAYWSAYAASKAAVASLSKCLAVEFSGKGVRVNSVCPGGVNTTLASTYSVPPDVDMALVQRLFPLHEAAEPEEIAAAVAYLASDEARYVTGVSFNIDGGQLT